jgi:hypothetical protein
MPRPEDIRNTIWLDLDGLSNDAIYLYIWSWTNERCGMSGIYSCPRRYLFEGRLDAEVLTAALEECETAGKLRYEDGVLWSVTRVKRLPWKTTQTAKAIVTELGELDRDNPIHAEFVEKYDGYPWGKEGKGPPLTLTQGSSDPHPRVKQGSVEDQATLDQDGSVEPSRRASSDPQPRVTGTGKGYGTGTGKGSGSGGSAASVDVVDGAPESLGPVAEILGRISETRGVPFAPLERIAAAIATYPDADHVAVASDFEDWLCNGSGRTREVKDLIQEFRGQLDRKQRPALAAVGAEASKDLSAYDQVMEPAA